MCLYATHKKAKIARKNITCYKILFKNRKVFLPEKIQHIHGKTFFGCINGIHCEGIISIYCDEIYFCTDHHQLDGQDTPEKFGKKYSWVFDITVKEIIIDEKINLESLETTVEYTTPYRNVEVKIGEEYNSELICDSFMQVDVGLHSYQTLNKALKNKDQNEEIVKCIIPKGSHYYIGKGEEYASDKLRYIETCE